MDKFDKIYNVCLTELLTHRQLKKLIRFTFNVINKFYLKHIS